MFSSMDKLENIFVRNIDLHVLCVARLIGKSMFLALDTFKTCGKTRKHCFRKKNVSESVCMETSETMFAEVGKLCVCPGLNKRH